MDRERAAPLTRRTFLRQASAATLAIGGLSTVGAAGCRGGTQAEGELTVWFVAAGANPQDDKRNWQESFRLFENERGVKVKGVAQTLDGFIPAWKSAVSARQGPDLQYLWEGVFTLEDAWRGNLEPYDTYLESKESQHWLGTASVKWDGRLWNSPRLLDSLVLLANRKLFEKAGLDPDTPLDSWVQFTNVCARLKDAGITPLGFGLKDGFGGGWLFSGWARGHLDNVADYMEAVAGDADITDDRYSEWWFRLAELRDNGYFNDDVGSLNLFDAVNGLFGKEQVAMVPTAMGGLRPLLKQVGEGNVRIISNWPSFGEGQLGMKNVTIFSGGMVIPSFSPNKELAAEFAAFLHDPNRLAAQYRQTSDLPADDRLEAELIQEAWTREMYTIIKTNPGPWLEDWIPTQMDSEANFAGCQAIFAGETPQDQVKRTKSVLEKWRSQSRDLVEAYTKWIDDARRAYEA